MTTTIALLVFIVLSAAVVGGFVYVARSANTDAAATPLSPELAQRCRKWLLLFLCAVSVVFLVLTLPLMPYPDDSAPTDEVVYVRSRQFAFELSGKPFPTDSNEHIGSDLSTLPVGKLIEFRIESIDVTHGFGIYTEDGQLLGQTQILPGYVNRMRFRFEAPGKYNVLCMEFCGLAHHVMRTTLEVR